MSGSSTVGNSLTDPLLPRQEQQSEFCCTLDPIQEENTLQLQVNESSVHHQDIDCNGYLPNVRRIFALTWFGFTGRAIWSQNVLSIFIYLWYPQHLEWVGYITATMGLSQVLSTSITQSCLVPIWKRHHLLRLAAVIGFGAIISSMYTLLLKNKWYWLLGGLSAWGFMWGIMDVALPSLFAASLPDQQQFLYYTRASRVIRASNTVGPLLVYGLFWLYLGDKWTIQNCSIVLAIGFAFCLPMVVLLCCLCEVEEESDLPGEIHFDHVHLGTDDCQRQQHDNMFPTETSANVTEETAAITALLDSSEDIETGEEGPRSTVCGCCSESFLIPMLISIGSIVSGVASGISIRYFPIFFVSNLDLSPTFVQVLYLITPLGQAVTKVLAKQMTRILGASCVTLMFQWTFVAVLTMMLYCYQQDVSVWIVCALYLWHSFLMNSTTALTQSILWCTISEGNVSKWTITETLQLLLWSVGAAIGGYLAGTKGLVMCFYATAGLQVLASLPVLFICCLGPSRDRVNSILFPSTPGWSAHPFMSVHDESSDEDITNFEDSREILDDSDGSLSVEFFECFSDQKIVGDRSNERLLMTARYDAAKRCCIYADDSSAYVPAGTSIGVIPSNYRKICRRNIYHAQIMWKATQQWRRDNQVWKIHTLPNPWYRRIKEAYPHFIHGFTKEGDVVVYEKPGKMKLKELFREGCTIVDMTRWYSFFMEYLSNCVPSTSERDDWGFVVVMDMRGAGISMLSGDVLSYLKQAGNINSAHYPLTMKRSFLVHAGSMVAGVWSGVRKVLPESVHVEVFKSPISLFDYIDEDQIPPEYGGTSPIELGQHPDELALCSLLQSVSN